MGLLDRLLGRIPRRDDDPYRRASGTPAYGSPPGDPGYAARSYPPEPGGTEERSRRDEEAIRRYRYLLRTAPPEAIEQAHAEAFAQLTPDQRHQVLTQLANHVPEHERARDDDPRSLARMATRAEMRQPGFLERSFASPGYGRGYGGGGMMGGGLGMGGMGMGMGGMLAGGLLASIAGSFIGTAIAAEMFDQNDYMASGFADGSEGGGDAGGSDINFDNEQVDASGVDSGGGDAGGGGGDAFGDFGGGDFGGGDFGGGDFGGGDW
jgi:predicted lipid-binding transport protein (Tim44 family)